MSIRSDHPSSPRGGRGSQQPGAKTHPLPSPVSREPCFKGAPSQGPVGSTGLGQNCKTTRKANDLTAELIQLTMIPNAFVVYMVKCSAVGEWSGEGLNLFYRNPNPAGAGWAG
jgi:hypothetical protein